MRTKAVVPGFKNSQKIRVMIGEFGFYMTVGNVDEVICTRKHYEVVMMGIKILAQMRKEAKENNDAEPVGLARDYNGISVQIDLY